MSSYLKISIVTAVFASCWLKYNAILEGILVLDAFEDFSLKFVQLIANECFNLFGGVLLRLGFIGGFWVFWVVLGCFGVF